MTDKKRLVMIDRDDLDLLIDVADDWTTTAEGTTMDPDALARLERVSRAVDANRARLRLFGG